MELPRDNLVRAVFPADLELREEESAGGMPTLTGHFAIFNEWTEINSTFEGNFLERVAPGAFKKTLRENQPKILFQHGRDPQIGDKPLGIGKFREDERGAYYEAPLFDTSYNRDLIEPLKAGAYGASFRFGVVKEEFNRDAEKSDYNPRGLPERTITEARVMECGPVTFPAYAGATAGVRSLTDDYMLGRFSYAPARVVAQDEVARMDSEDLATLAQMIMCGTAYIEEQDEPGDAANIPVMEDILRRLAALVPYEVQEDEGAEPEDEEMNSQEPSHSDESRDTPADDTTTATEPPHSDEPSRDTPPPDERTNAETEKEKTVDSIEEIQQRQKEVRAELEDIAAANRGAVMGGVDRNKWDMLTAEMEDLKARKDEESERLEYLRMIADDVDHQDGETTKPNPGAGTGAYVTHRAGRDKAPDDPFDMTGYHGQARDTEHLLTLYKEGARKAVDGFHYPHNRGLDEAKASENVEMLLEQVDSPDKIIARRVLSCGSPLYRKAFWKMIAKIPLTNEEQRAMAQAQMEMRTEAYGLTTGGAVVAIPIQIDPTVILTSAGAINPIRQIARVVNTTSYQFQGVTTGGVVANYQAEGVTTLNNAGTFNNPQFFPERVTSFVPYSYEVAQDFGGLEAELAREIADAKNVLEATKFSLGAGHGSNEPQGILIGAGTVVATSGGTAGTGFSVSDVYALEAALPARQLENAKWVAGIGVYQRVRQQDTAGGAALWVQLPSGNPPQLLGYDAYKSSVIGTSITGSNVLTAGSYWGVFGNWDRYLVVDRPGMFVRNIPDLFGGTAGIHFPTGQSGLLGFWRNTAGVLDSGAFRVGTISKGVN